MRPFVSKRSSRFLFLNFLFLLFASNTGAQTLDHFGIGSPEMQVLDSALIETGKVPSFFSRPFSNYHYLKELQRLDRNSKKLPGYYNQVFHDIRGLLKNQESKKVFIKPLLDSNVMLQYLSHEMSEFDKYLYYRKSIEEAPLLGLGFSGGTSHVMGKMYFDLRRDFFSSHTPSEFTNLPLGEVVLQEFDFNFPTRGYVIIGNEYADILIGRDRIRWGPGYRGSLVLSDSPPYYDMISSSLHLPNFKYSLVYASLESYLTADEYILQSERSNTGAISFRKQNTDQYKTLAGHRIEFRLFNRVNIGLTETIVVGGRVPELAELTPMMFFHNVYGENYSNVNIGLDIAVVPLRKVMLYGEFMIEDIRHAYESEISPPDSFGSMAGIQFVHALGGGALDARLEWVHIDPWVYNRWQPYSIFTSRKKFLSPASGHNQILDFPTGYFLGPDVESLFLQLSWSRYSSIDVRLNYEYRRKGRIYLDPLDPESDFVERLNEDLETPTGTPVISHIVGLGGDINVRSWLKCSLDLSTGSRRNASHIPGNDYPFFEVRFNSTFTLF